MQEETYNSSSGSTCTLVYEGMPKLIPDEKRSEGVHVSQLIHKRLVRLGIYKANSGLELTDTWAQAGLVFEWALVKIMQWRWPGKYERLGELVDENDIYFTIDLWDRIEESVHEIKMAWMKADNFPFGRKFWRYEMQLKAYCYKLDTYVGYIHVFFVNGGQGGLGPRYKVYRYVFTPDDLHENWRCLMIEKRALEKGN